VSAPGPAPAFRLAPPRRPARAEGVVPLINIVFLLLIFFMMSATIAPPEPLPVTPPAADAAEAVTPAGEVLHVGADGALAWGSLRDDAVLAALAAAPVQELVVRADAGLDGAGFAALMARLRAAGVEAVVLAVVAR
jgi:biopolymer transport protein ExbD